MFKLVECLNFEAFGIFCLDQFGLDLLFFRKGLIIATFFFYVEMLNSD